MWRAAGVSVCTNWRQMSAMFFCVLSNSCSNYVSPLATKRRCCRERHVDHAACDALQPARTADQGHVPPMFAARSKRRASWPKKSAAGTRVCSRACCSSQFCTDSSHSLDTTPNDLWHATSWFKMDTSIWVEYFASCDSQTVFDTLQMDGHSGSSVCL